MQAATEQQTPRLPGCLAQAASCRALRFGEHTYTYLTIVECPVFPHPALEGGTINKYFLLLLAGAVALVMTPAASLAQEDEAPEPEIHYVTATVFNVPPGEEGQKVMGWIDAVMVPIAEVNPHVLHSSVLQHNWGSNSAAIVLAAEYADWASIEADCEECGAWFEENQPAEGTPEREEWDEMATAFFKAYSGHRDEIYTKNMNRAK